MDATLSKELRKLALEIRIGIVEQIQARGFGHIGGNIARMAHDGWPTLWPSCTAP